MKTINMALSCLLAILLAGAASISEIMAQAPPAWQLAPAHLQQDQTPEPDTDPTLPASPTSSEPTETRQPSPPPIIEISGVEPRRFEQLKGGLLSIYGVGFPPQTSVRLVGYGILETNVLSSQALQCMIPPGLRAGKYDLELLLPEGSAMRVPGNITIQAPETTATSQPSGPSVYAQPQLMIRSASSDPMMLQRGEPFLLTLEIENRGSYSTSRGQITLASPDLVMPQTGSNVIILQPMTSGQVIEVPLTLTTDEQAPGGMNNLEILLEYADYYGRSYLSTQTIALQVDASSSSSGLVLLEGYHTIPEQLSPGDLFDLQLTLRNAGQGNVEQLVITLGDPAGTGIKPFALLGTGNVLFVETLKAGESIDLGRKVIIEGTADAGAYSLPIHIQYDGGNETTSSQVQVLTLLVMNIPQIQVSYYRPIELVQVGQTIELPIEIMNIGRTSINISQVEVFADQIEIENGSAFIGSLDGGTSAFIDALGIPKKSGELELQLTVNYMDDFNQPQVITEMLSLNVETPPELPSGPNGMAPEQEGGFAQSLLHFIRGLFGLGS